MWHLEGKKEAEAQSLPGKVHVSPSLRPVFSTCKARSKTFFSSSIFSIVKSPFSTIPASGESPASVMNAERVYHDFCFCESVFHLMKEILSTHAPCCNYWL